MNYDHELKIALEAAEVAGRFLREQYARFQPIPNAPSNISTAADCESQEIILQQLAKHFPNDAFCAEESTPTLVQVSQTGNRLWIIDPIDGTRGFARKNGEFSVMIAFVDRGRVAVGGVLEPALDRLTYAVTAGGCWRRDGTEKQASPCRVSTVSDLTRATVTLSRSHQSSPPSELHGLKPARILTTYSAGIKLAQVARGEADIYLNTYPAFHDWDICAGHLLVTEAGGTVTGLAGQELRYGLPHALQTFGLLATNGRLHGPALAVLKTH
ncbi:MAG TPA: inositol monophosphatase family protein [Gemmataceae bacterium]|nr:inositol monophosphatase family protein [Gemmataceae bacterium]